MDKKRNKQKSPQARKRRRIIGITIKIAIILFVLAICAVISAAIISAASDVFGISDEERIVEVQVEPNSTGREIAYQLQESEVIRYPNIFLAYIKYMVEEVNFKFGTFTLNSTMTYDELIAELSRSTVSGAAAEVTIYEGQTVSEIATLLQEKGVCSAEDFLDAAEARALDTELLQAASEVEEVRPYQLEGYLFPDTYNFYFGDDPNAVLDKLMGNFADKIDEDIVAEAASMGLNVDQLITFASIVQAEAANFEDMQMVASVYWNRYHDSETFRRWQADPTSHYARDVLKPLGVSQEILDSYDTYVREGMPAGPINNPGMNAIWAVLDPESTDYYYFCCNREGTEFYYATNLDDHLVNVEAAGLND